MLEFRAGEPEVVYSDKPLPWVEGEPLARKIAPPTQQEDE